MDKKKTIYTVSEIKELIKQLQNVFDIVRLVDPIETAIISIGEDDSIIRENYVCYAVWKKRGRCENCISIKAFNEDERKTKYEFINDDVYYVVSLPVTLKDNEGVDLKIIIEMVSNVTDEVLFEAFGKGHIIDKINETNKKLYEDSLTKAYNRRYFDEYVFLHNNTQQEYQSVSFIMLDLTDFKTINDTYGHDIGDKALREVVKVLKANIRKQDCVIRLGGDEFLIVLKSFKEDNVHNKISELKRELRTIEYDKEKHLCLDGSFGYSYSSCFNPSKDCIAFMLKEADKKMYEDKNKSN